MITSAGGPQSARSCHRLPAGYLGTLLARVADELRTTDLDLIGPRRGAQVPQRRPETAP